MNVDAVVLGALAALPALTGGAALRLAWKARRLGARLERMAATAVTRIADANPPAGGVAIEIAGTAHAVTPDARVMSPLGGARCLFFRVEVAESAGSTITTLATKTGSCDLVVDDGSNACARVRMERADVVFATRSPAADVAGAKALLDELGIRKSPEDLLWFEERIDEGAEVYVLGFASAREAPADAPFRGAPERLVVDAPEGGELVVSVGTEATVAAALGRRRDETARIARAMGITAAVLAAGLAALALAIR